MPATLTLTEDEVVDLCALSGPRINFCVYPATNPVYFIKYGGNHAMGEARTQSYVYDRTTDVPGGPRVPKILHAFERGKRTHMVMEYIDAPTLDEFLVKYPSKKESVYTSIASGLSWLLHLPLPQDTCLGPVGGGFAVHRFFGPDHRAPLEFAHVAALQRYVNKALRRTPGRGPKKTVDFESEERCFYHSDIRGPNFLVNPETEEITFVDFQHVGILTTSFASYALTVNDTFICDIATRIDFPRSAQISAMALAAGLITQSGCSKFGLDEQGFPTEKTRLAREKARKLEGFNAPPDLVLTTDPPWL